ncbi:MAG: PAS domain S-box protein [Desulfuromonadales bacterium]|nr:PAS domain S-box protein [Desulfuromonadales bacterium]MDW7757908.1 PAS domain S-box protein [Desulfuromonadales bacterium]
MPSLPIIIDFLQNTILLLALGALYGTIQQYPDTLGRKLFTGVFIGLISVSLIANPWQLIPGVIFDSRSILLSVGGLFFGLVPTAVAIVISWLYRLHLGGPGTLTGILAILASGGIGVALGRLRHKPAYRISIGEWYLFGFGVQSVVLLLMFTLPAEIALPVLRNVTVPTLVLYPIITILLGKLLASQEEHIRRKLALDASERNYRELVQQSRVIILRMDREGKVTFINEYGQKFFGYTHQELVGQAVVGTIVPEFDQAGHDLGKMVKTALQVPEPFLENENENRCKDGRLVRIQWKNTPLYDSDLDYAGLHCIGHDVTELRRAEATLRSKEQYLQLLVELAPIPLLILERHRDITYANRAFSDLFGYTLTECPTLDAWRLRAFPDAAYRARIEKNFEKAIVQARRDGEPVETQALAITCKNGSVCEVLARYAAIEDKEIVVFNDITREREIDRLKSEFISTAAHELRTPLASVKGFAELLLEEKSFDEAQRDEFLGIIYEKSEVLEHIIDDLLDISRVESGRMIHIEKKPCDLRAQIASSVHAYQREFRQRRIELDWPDQGPEKIPFDPYKIEQVMENLLSNAVKFSPPDRPIRVSGRFTEQEVTISVKDEGIGIAPKDLLRIFDKFYRADSSDTAVPGMGLGMGIAKGIVEAHGGRMEVQSTPGQGTTVSFSLPLHEKETFCHEQAG